MGKLGGREVERGNECMIVKEERGGVEKRFGRA